MQAKARQRGRDVMKAVAEEYPGMTIFFYRMFSDMLRFADRQGANLQTYPYGLLPAFIDGWCDVMPATITLIDGNEAASHYENTDQYAVGYGRLKKQAPRFISAENRTKFGRQFLISHDIYLDAQLPNGPFALDLHGVSPAAHLLAFTSAALDYTDEFVWIYGEKGRFWPSQNNSQPAWTNKFPGIEAALRAASEPAEFAREALANSQPKDNLLKDTAFNDGDWSPWQDNGSKGTAKLGLGFATLAQMKYGAALQTLPVKAGQAYIVAVKVKQTGLGTAGLLINWKDNLKWVAQNDLAEFTAAAAPDADGWRQIVGLIIVPAQANRLVFLCTAGGQEGDKSQAVFKDPVVISAL
jgi:subtilisin family serine protease